MNGGTAAPAPPVVELIPGEHYLVFLDQSPDLMPDEEAIEELRILAYARRDKPVLGPGAAGTIATLAEAVSTGVASSALWAGCQAASQYVQRRRAASKGPQVTSPDEASQKAVQAIESPAVPVAASTATAVRAACPDGTAWMITVEGTGQAVQVHLEAAGATADVIIGGRP